MKPFTYDNLNKLKMNDMQQKKSLNVGGRSVITISKLITFTTPKHNLWLNNLILWSYLAMHKLPQKSLKLLKHLVG
jgi:hypothetical protein